MVPVMPSIIDWTKPIFIQNNRPKMTPVIVPSIPIAAPDIRNVRKIIGATLALLFAKRKRRAAGFDGFFAPASFWVASRGAWPLCDQTLRAST